MNVSLILENGTNSLPNISAADDTTIMTAISSINIILGLPINSYAMWLILSGAGGTIASEFYFLNLIVSVVIPLVASVLYFVDYFHAVFSAIFLFFVSVPSFQCCICVERYIAVIHPVVFLRCKALRYKVACCCVVWLMVLAYSIGFTVCPSETLLKVGGYILLGFYVVCISVVSFCCLSVLRALKQPGPGEGQRDGGGEGNDMKRRAFKIILTSLIVMLLTMMIFTANLVTTLFKNHIPIVITYVMYALTIKSGLVHPLLYIHKAGKLPCFKGL